MDYMKTKITPKNSGVGSLFLLQGIFPSRGSNPGLPHCRRTLNQLSHKGSPRMLEWVTYRFSSRSSWPRSRTGVSCIAGEFFTNWAIREALTCHRSQQKIQKSEEKFHQKFFLFTHTHTHPGVHSHSNKIYKIEGKYVHSFWEIWK